MSTGFIARVGICGTLTLLVLIALAAVAPIFFPGAITARMDAAQNLTAQVSAPAVSLPTIISTPGMTKNTLEDSLSRIVNPNGGVFFTVNGTAILATLDKIGGGKDRPPKNCSWEWVFHRPAGSKWPTETVRLAACMVFEFVEWLGQGNTPNGRWVP